MCYTCHLLIYLLINLNAMRHVDVNNAVSYRNGDVMIGFAAVSIVLLILLLKLLLSSRKCVVLLVNLRRNGHRRLPSSICRNISINY